MNKTAIAIIAKVVLLCGIVEFSAFGGLVLYDWSRGASLAAAFKQRRNQHPAAATVIRQVSYGAFDPVVGNTYEPNSKVANITINTHGFPSNGNDDPLLASYPDKPANVFRIAVLGNSTLAGVGMRDEKPKTITAFVEQMLNETARDGRRYQVLNYGISGAYSFSELRLFFGHVINTKPDMVISLSGWVDAVEAAFHAERSGLKHGLVNWGDLAYRQADFFAGASERTASRPYIFTYVYIALEELGFFAKPPDTSRAARYNKIAWFEDSERYLAVNGGLQSLFPQNVEAVAAYSQATGIYFLGYLQPFADYLHTPNETEKTGLDEYRSTAIQGGATYFAYDYYKPRITPVYALYQRAYADLQRKYASSDKARFFDIANLFETTSEQVYVDVAHYNERGNLLIAQRLANDIRALIDNKTIPHRTDSGSK